MYSIKYRKLIFSQLRRYFLAIQSPYEDWKGLKKDHALEWGQIKATTQNWGFEIGDKNNPTEIELANNNNHPLKIWTTNNKGRKYLKINQQYHYGAEKDQNNVKVAVWFYHSIYIMQEIMISYEKIKNYKFDTEEQKFFEYINESINRFDNLKISKNQHNRIYSWMEEEIKNMSKISLDMSWCFTGKKSETPFAEACNEVLDHYLILIKKNDNKTICGTITKKELIKILPQPLNDKQPANIEINEQNIYIEEIINRYYLTNNLFDQTSKNIKNIEIYKSSNLENNYEELERVYKKKQRVEQSQLRAKYFDNDSSNIDCAVCGRSMNKRFVWMAHLKPRKSCTKIEKKDLNVVIPMCKFGCDDLYEEGHIYIDDGIVKKNNFKSSNLFTKAMLDYVSEITGNKVKYWDGYEFKGFITNGLKRKRYCTYHYEKNR